MPLYDYTCTLCTLRWDEVRAIHNRVMPCPDCLAPTPPDITFRGALLGLTTPGSSTIAWDHKGMWGRTKNGESPHLAQLRTMLEDGAFKQADNRTRQSALTFVRTHELAKEQGQHAEARHIEGRMARLVEDRNRELRGEPEQPVKGVYKTVETRRRRSKRGIEVERVVKYT